ncbi:MauE/DoxX family redox-associated membrane protein [Mucilaginibacter sp. 14171R-50]|uniref:DoxX family protein n=1 Tax=Mucilaginibacter sp. 14171R-50 TaxID=2703789 RepID=UPI001EE431E9|nr:MauE/DoxX family redox-associated membrane protein [Mucilaginibacter sp. 14171R-50]
MSKKIKNLKKISLVILIAGYLAAGANHFYNPQSYYRIIPAYIPYPIIANVLAGVFEIAFALMLISPKTRKIASWGIILMLGAFLPVHISMIINAPVNLGSLTVTPAIAWVRLLLQPVLMFWAWWHSKS